ncbi:hypothetical protein Tco_0894499 [Tanacetum coccineum]|uniref:Uncharacterized protein n=1 Tax=Tanacetum coccineum TaxID=301880 RepID=A0ABQ5CDC8_9ASTR
MVFHNEDGNPARANIKQALGYLKDGDGDGNSQYLRCQVNNRMPRKSMYYVSCGYLMFEISKTLSMHRRLWNDIVRRRDPEQTVKYDTTTIAKPGKTKFDHTWLTSLRLPVIFYRRNNA